MSTHTIPLSQLRPHPDNSNVMPGILVNKLANHIQRTGRYPPLIVRPHHDKDLTTAGGSPNTDLYQILDGHHRALALKDIGHDTAECIVWHADDSESTILLATLNRLQGQDDPHKRARLMDALATQHNLKELTSLLPERVEQIKKYLEFKDRPPALRPPKPIEQMPVTVHFFLLPDDKVRLDRALHQIEGSREEALMNLISRLESNNQIPNDKETHTIN